MLSGSFYFIYLVRFSEPATRKISISNTFYFLYHRIYLSSLNIKYESASSIRQLWAEKSRALHQLYIMSNTFFKTSPRGKINKTLVHIAENKTYSLNPGNTNLSISSSWSGARSLSTCRTSLFFIMEAEQSRFVNVRFL